MAKTEKTYLDHEGLTTLIGLIKNYISTLALTKITDITYDSDNADLVYKRGNGQEVSLNISDWLRDFYLSGADIENGFLILSLSNNGVKDDDKTIRVDLKKWVDINEYSTADTINKTYLKSNDASKNYLKIADAGAIYVNADGGILSIQADTINSIWDSATVTT